MLGSGIQQDSDGKCRAAGGWEQTGGLVKAQVWRQTAQVQSQVSFVRCMMLKRGDVSKEKDWSNTDRTQLSSFLPALVPRKEESGTN